VMMIMAVMMVTISLPPFLLVTTSYVLVDYYMIDDTGGWLSA